MRSPNTFVEGLGSNVCNDPAVDPRGSILSPWPAFCLVPAFKGNSDHICPFCILDTSPDGTKNLIVCAAKNRRWSQKLGCPSPAPLLPPLYVFACLLGVGAVHQASPTSSMVRMYPLWTVQRQIDVFPQTLGFSPLVGHVEAAHLGPDFHREACLGPHPESLLQTPARGHTQERRRREVFLKNGGSCGTGRTMRRLSRAKVVNLGTGFELRLGTIIQLRMKSPL